MLVCSELNSEQAAVVFKIEHPAYTRALKISVLLLSRPPKSEHCQRFYEYTP
jgi:hypothetical protein